MTLDRVLEPEVMDTPEEAADYDAMDHGPVNEAFVDDLLAIVEPLERGQAWTVLDLGSGTAQQPILLCERCPQARVMAVDLSREMLELARYNVEAAGLTERIQLAHMDAKQLDCADASFDAVISNSIIHHIPEPLAVLRESARVVKPGGRLFFRDLLRPQMKSQLEALVQQYAGVESEHARQMFADSLHAALTVEEMTQLLGSLGFSAESITATTDRHWTFSAVAV